MSSSQQAWSLGLAVSVLHGKKLRQGGRWERGGPADLQPSPCCQSPWDTASQYRAHTRAGQDFAVVWFSKTCSAGKRILLRENSRKWRHVFSPPLRGCHAFFWSWLVLLFLLDSGQGICEAMFLFSPQRSGPQFQSEFNKQELTSRQLAKRRTDLAVLGMGLLPVFTALGFSKAD